MKIQTLNEIKARAAAAFPQVEGPIDTALVIASAKDVPVLVDYAEKTLEERDEIRAVLPLILGSAADKLKIVAGLYAAKELFDQKSRALADFHAELKRANDRANSDGREFQEIEAELENVRRVLKRFVDVQAAGAATPSTLQALATEAEVELLRERVKARDFRRKREVVVSAALDVRRAPTDAARAAALELLNAAVDELVRGTAG